MENVFKEREIDGKIKQYKNNHHDYTQCLAYIFNKKGH
jgi:hypothetical protein